ncbi:MAG: prepilin-type N-terminal cleavage/methylation protein [Proteobacteria bacterium]|nr:prepilin-type N-terminal cleavage/methylation protein [Pseudomonadota bacterium]
MQASIKKQNGMTLTESLLVLAVGALIAVLAYGAYRMATSDVKVQSQVQGITQLVGKIKQVFGTGATYGTADMVKSIVDAKIVPADIKIGGTAAAPTLSNAWGGGVTIVGAGAAFTITIVGVPSEGCIQFLSGISSAANSMTMGGTSVKATGANFDPAAAATQCAASTGSGATSTAVLTAQ